MKNEEREGFLRNGELRIQNEERERVFPSLSVECWFLWFECFHISSSTLYGVTNPVTEVTKLVTHEESLTLLLRGK